MRKALCIDVGATRIKAAVLPKRLTVASLERQQVFTTGTLGWLNQSLPELLSADNPFSLVNQPLLAKGYDEIGVCVPGPVDNSNFRRSDLGVPTDLARQFAKFTDKPVTLVKDADAWLIGALACLELMDQEVEYPAIGLTLGTGIGLAIAIDAAHFLSLEISALQSRFGETEKTSGQQIGDAWQVHSIVGHQFFGWVRSEKQHWTCNRIQDEYTKRVVAVLKDVLSSGNCGTDSPKTILVGGGNAAFVSIGELENEIGSNVRVLSGSGSDIDSDLLSLMGLHKLVFTDSVRIES